jgi:hypothetical protein
MFFNSTRVSVAFALALGLVLVTAGVAQADPERGRGDRGYRQAPQQHTSGERRSNTGRNLAVGIAAGVLGAIILNQAARAGERDHGGDDEGGLSCRQLDRRCDDGQEWACRKFARRCE